MTLMKTHADSAPRLSVAPMMDWTDDACRNLHRCLSRRALLYTEMVTSAALVRGGATRLLEMTLGQGPVALQLGGSDPGELAEAAAMGGAYGYDEINLNVGCPSDRVQSGCFGAVLMRRPDLVAECVRRMQAQVRQPVTVKCRIGVDEQDPAQVLPDFLARMRDAGVPRVIVHARKAWLQGLSPKENREVPPLDYPLVQRMAREFPELDIWINGGIGDLDVAARLLDEAPFGGVMIGRAAYHDPTRVLLTADSRLHGAADPVASAREAVAALRPFIAAHLARGGRLHDYSRHMLGLFTGRPGARAWRRILSEGAHLPDAGLDLIDRALAAVPAPARCSAVAAQ